MAILGDNPLTNLYNIYQAGSFVYSEFYLLSFFLIFVEFDSKNPRRRVKDAAPYIRYVKTLLF